MSTSSNPFSETPDASFSVELPELSVLLSSHEPLKAHISSLLSTTQHQFTEVLKKLDKKTKKQQIRLSQEIEKNHNLEKELAEKSTFVNGVEEKIGRVRTALEERCRVLQDMLDGVIKEKDKARAELGNCRLRLEAKEKEVGEKEGELRFFVSKYRGEYLKDKRIAELEQMLKVLEKNRGDKDNERAESTRNMSIVETLQIDIAGREKIEQLEKELEEERGKVKGDEGRFVELERRNEHLNNKLQKQREEIEALKMEVTGLREKEELHEIQLEDERKIAFQEALKIPTSSETDKKKIHSLEELNSKLENRIKELDEDIKLLLKKLNLMKNSMPQKTLNHQSSPSAQDSAIMESLVSQNSILKV